jgi:hypothetical protein
MTTDDPDGSLYAAQCEGEANNIAMQQIDAATEFSKFVDAIGIVGVFIDRTASIKVRHTKKPSRNGFSEYAFVSMETGRDVVVWPEEWDKFNRLIYIGGLCVWTCETMPLHRGSAIREVVRNVCPASVVDYFAKRYLQSAGAGVQ